MGEAYVAGGSRWSRFAGGVALGLLVVPLTTYGAGLVDFPLLEPLVLVFLTAVTVALPRPSGARVAGVLTGIAALTALGFGILSLLFASGRPG